MLVLSRGAGDTVLIGEDIEILVADVGKGKVRMAFKAPKEIPITRGRKVPFEVRAGQREPARKQRARPSGKDHARPARFAPKRSAETAGRRRVVIEPEPEPAWAASTVGEGLLGDAVRAADPDALESVARGEAIDGRIGEALMELARAELSARKRRGTSDPAVEVQADTVSSP